jgi:hemolysin activation/secretion protein
LAPQLSLPEIVVPPPSQTVPKGAASANFTLSDVIVSGATVYPPSVFKDIYGGSIGKSVSVAELYSWAAQITDRYRKDGYLLSQAVIPAQHIRGGVIRIQVIEGFVGQVRIQGPSNRLLHEYADRLTQSQPLNSRDLERYLLLANDLPGYTVHVVLSPSKTVPGASDLTLVSTHKLEDFQVSVDNQGTEYIGPWEGTAVASLNDALGHGERLSVRVSTTPSIHELQLFGISASVPLNAEGLSLLVDASRTRARPGFTLAQFYPHTQGDTATVNLQKMLIRSRAQTLSLTGGLTYEDSISVLTPPGAALPPSSNDKLWVVRFGPNYSLTDAYGGRNDMSLQISHGLKIDNASNPDRPNPSKPHGRSDFTKFTASLSRLQAITGPYAVLAAVTGQVTPSQSLLSAEQFGVGGAQFGRGYDPSELTGDDGVAAKIEAQATYGLSYYRLQTAQFFAFYDTGYVRSRYPFSINADTESHATLASTGGGVRLALRGGYLTSFEIAKPLTRPPAIYVGHLGDPKAPRFYFSFIASF